MVQNIHNLTKHYLNKIQFSFFIFFVCLTKKFLDTKSEKERKKERQEEGNEEVEEEEEEEEE